MGKFTLYTDGEIRCGRFNLRELVDFCRKKWGIEADPMLWCVLPSGGLPRCLVDITLEDQGDESSRYYCLHLNTGETNRDPMRLHKLRGMLLGKTTWSRPLTVALNGEVHEYYNLELVGDHGIQEVRFNLQWGSRG